MPLRIIALPEECVRLPQIPSLKYVAVTAKVWEGEDLACAMRPFPGFRAGKRAMIGTQASLWGTGLLVCLNFCGSFENCSL